MYYYLVPLLRKRPDKIILHVGTNDAPHMKADEMLEELGKLKSLICEMLPSVKIVLSAPTIRVDKHNANENNINFIKLLETNNYVLIKHPNIKENHLDRYGLHHIDVETTSCVYWEEQLKPILNIFLGAFKIAQKKRIKRPRVTQVYFP